jgi:hypothetical protein
MVNSIVPVHRCLQQLLNPLLRLSIPAELPEYHNVPHTHLRSLAAPLNSASLFYKTATPVKGCPEH